MKWSRVLLVSDEKELEGLFSQALDKRRMHLDVAASEAEALDIASHAGLQVAFVDFDMPGFDQGVLLEGLRGIDKGVIAAGVASLKSKARAVGLARLGLSDYLIKPVMAEELNFFLDRQEEICGLREKVACFTSDLCSSVPLIDLVSKSDISFKTKLKEFVSILGKLDSCNVHELVLTRVEKTLLELVLAQTKGNKIKAANMLGLNRNTLHRKIQELNITFKKPRRRGPEPAGEPV